MNYEKEILQILTEAGTKGLSVRKIARHVYNTSNTFFNVLDFEEVHAAVQQYLFRNSRKKNAVIEKTPVRGVYRINKNSAEFRQLMLLFMPEEDTVVKKPSMDGSLSLFDDF